MYRCQLYVILFYNTSMEDIIAVMRSCVGCHVYCIPLPRVALHAKASSLSWQLKTLHGALISLNQLLSNHKAMSNHAQVSGEPTETTTSLVETATGAIQGFRPIKQIHEHLCAFHFYGYDMTRQVEAHHFCAHQNEEMRQCLIYDTPEADAKLIGLEYMISENLFLTLPDEEKPLWHSHLYEVKSGVLFMPRVPGPIERHGLDKVCKTYGKTIHFWQVDKGDNLPLGLPQLMMALTRDGQLDEELGRDVEKRFGVSFEKERAKRAELTGPTHGIHPLANGGGKGLIPKLREVDCKPADSVPRVFV